MLKLMHFLMRFCARLSAIVEIIGIMVFIGCRKVLLKDITWPADYYERF